MNFKEITESKIHANPLTPTQKQWYKDKNFATAFAQIRTIINCQPHLIHDRLTNEVLLSETNFLFAPALKEKLSEDQFQYLISYWGSFVYYNHERMWDLWEIKNST